MPSSQEEYLDALLRGVTEPEAKPDEQEIEERETAVEEPEEAVPEEVFAEMDAEMEAEPDAEMAAEPFVTAEALAFGMDEQGILPAAMEFQDIISDDITLGDLMPEEAVPEEPVVPAEEALSAEEPLTTGADLPVEKSLSAEAEPLLGLDDLDTLLKMAEEASGTVSPIMEMPEVELPELDIPDINQPFEFSYTNLTDDEPIIEEPIVDGSEEVPGEMPEEALEVSDEMPEEVPADVSAEASGEAPTELSDLGDLGDIGDIEALLQQLPEDIGIDPSELENMTSIDVENIIPDEIATAGEVSEEAPEEVLGEIPETVAEEAMTEAPGEVSEEALEASGEVPTELSDLGDLGDIGDIEALLQQISENDVPPETSEPELSEVELPEPELSNPELSGLDMAELDVPEPELPEPELSNPELPEMDLAGVDFPMDAAGTEPEEEDDSNVQLTQEEIEQMLAASRAEFMASAAEESTAPEISEADDLMSLLQGTEDADLQEIHDMLQKADNNEAVDEGIAALMESFTDDGELAVDPLEDEAEEALSEREKRALEKKRQKEEKAAAKKAAKEAKRAAKEAKKAGAEKPENARETGAENGVKADARATNQKIQLPPDATVEADMAELDELLGLINGGEETEQPQADDGVVEVDIDEADMIREIGEQPKKGLFARILDYFTEEDEEEEPASGTEDVPISDENKAILDEMDKEKPKGKKGKKPKKGKNAESDEDFDEDGGAGKGKKAKEKKPKKEKVPKEKAPGGTGPKLSPKKVIPILVCGLSVMLAIVVIVNLGGEYTVKKEARKAFYQEDYETCYQNLYGKELNETEQVMLGKSESILRIRLWMREYEFFAEEGKEPQALDILIQSVKDYAPLYEYAQRWNADAEVARVYEKMLAILSDKYHLTEAQALEIAAEPDDLEYTKKVIEATGGTIPGAGAQIGPTHAEFTIEQLPDMLPEEMEFQENRIENP